VPVEPATHLEVLSEQAEALLEAASDAMGVPVPTCPDWTVADLVVHMGLVWGWAAEIVATKARADGGEAPRDRSDQAIHSWAKGQVAHLLDALGAAEPDADCWTFGPPRSVRFWFRRQALETVLHSSDTQGAVGRPSRIDPEVAADGVDEHLSVMVPRSVRLRPELWAGQTVHLHRTDGDGEWVVRLGPNGEVATERSHSKADFALRGTAEALWLWCTNRAAVGELGTEAFGDTEVADRWRTEMAT
jgi:uncharacterized protein (TIGR03083 family)